MNLPKPIKFEVERYVGGLSQFKKIENPIKLSANESALDQAQKPLMHLKKKKINFLNIQKMIQIL